MFEVCHKTDVLNVQNYVYKFRKCVKFVTQLKWSKGLRDWKYGCDSRLATVIF